MTDEKKTSSTNKNLIIGVMAGLLLLVGGVLAGVLLGGDGIFGAATTTTTTLPPTTTTTVPPTTTTLPPTTTTTAPSAPESQAVIPASEDTTVESDEPDDNLGDRAVLEVDQDGDDVKRSLIRFEVTEVPEGQEVVRATISMLQLDESEQGGSLSLVGGEWSEAETTWATAPPVGDTVAPLPGGEEGSIVEIDVSSVVTGNGTYDFYMTTLFDDAMDFAAKESGQGPSLFIEWGGEGDATTGAVLVGAGDIASCQSDGDEVTAGLIEGVVAASDEAVVFTVGDNAYEDGSLQQFNECYQPSWGRFKDITRPAVGAREYRTAGAAGHFAYYGSAAGDASEGYYSYELGGWHVLVLNSNCDEVECDADSPQEQWLREELETSSAACTLAYWHHPLFSSSAAGGESEVVDLYEALYDYGAEVVINADNHFYERFEPQDPDGVLDDEGIRQFTVGTGGRSLDNIGAPAANSAVRFNEAFGVLALTLFPGGYEWNFVTEADVVFSDTGSADCH